MLPFYLPYHEQPSWTFHLPIVQLADIPGFLIGPESEQAATIRRGVTALAKAQSLATKADFSSHTSDLSTIDGKIKIDDVLAGTATAPETEVKEITVGQVTDMGGIDDKSFNATAWKGVQDAMAEFGIEGKYLESQQQTDYEKNINEFIASGNLDGEGGTNSRCLRRTFKPSTR